MAPPELASVDGAIAPTAEAMIPLRDDGLYRGDGVFEVIRLYAGRPFALDEHLDRLERSAAAIELPVERAPRSSPRSRRCWSEYGDADAQLRLDRHPRRPAHRADRAAARLGRDRRPGDRHLLAERDPDRGQVALLRRQHAGHPDRQGARRRRGAAGAPRRGRARGAHLDDLLGHRRRAAHARARAPASSTRSRAAAIVGELEVAEGEFVLDDLLGARRPSSPRPRARSSRSRRSTTPCSSPDRAPRARSAAFARVVAASSSAPREPRPLMDLELTDEQRLIQETARDFVDNEVVPRARDSDRAERFDRELARRLGEMGYLGAPVAEEYGGRGLDYVTYGLIVEEVGRGDSAMRTVVSVQTSLVCGSIERWGHEEQKQRWLPRLCSGEALRLLRADRARHRLGRRQPAHPRREDRRRLADQRPEDVDLARQRRRGRADLRPDRPGEEAQGSRLLPGPDRQRRLRDPGDPRQARAARLRHGRDLARRGRGRRRRADGRGRRRLQGRDVGARLGALLGRRRLRRDLRGLREASVAYSKERKQFGVPIAQLPARPGDDRRHDRAPRRGADARPPRRDAQGRGQADAPSRPRSRSCTRPSRRSSARTSRSRSTAARATSTTTRSSATCATRG